MEGRFLARKGRGEGHCPKELTGARSTGDGRRAKPKGCNGSTCKRRETAKLVGARKKRQGIGVGQHCLWIAENQEVSPERPESGSWGGEVRREGNKMGSVNSQAP